MASCSTPTSSLARHYEFEDYENFQVTISKSSESIYLRMLNKVTYQNYEVNIQSFNLQSIPIKGLDNMYIFMIKCFEKKPKHNVTIEIKMEELDLQFASQLEEYFEIKFKVCVPLIIQSSDMEISSTVMRLEAKQKGDVEMLIRRMTEMERMLSIMSFAEISIGDIKCYQDVSGAGGCVLFKSLYVPFSTQNLYLEHIPTYNNPHQNHLCYRYKAINETLTRDIKQTYKIKFNHLYFNKLKLLPNLKKIHYIRDTTAEKEYSSTIGDDDSRFLDCFDFDVLNNSILEDLTIVNFPGVSSLTTIEKIQSLKVLQIENADQLSNASEYIKRLPNLKKLTFSGCPKIISEDSGRLNKYCADNGIEIHIS